MAKDGEEGGGKQASKELDPHHISECFQINGDPGMEDCKEGNGRLIVRSAIDYEPRLRGSDCRTDA